MKRAFYQQTYVSNDFLSTTVQSAILTSSTFLFNYNSVICIQLLIGLYVEYHAGVALRDSINYKYEVLDTVTVKGASIAPIYGLSIQQFVTITKFVNRSAIRYHGNLIYFWI